MAVCASVTISCTASLIRISSSPTHSLVEFDASHNKLAEVPSQLFQMPELTVLQLSNNSLEHLPGDPNGPDAESMSGGHFKYQQIAFSTILSH